MGESEEHLGGSIWRKMLDDGERYELRAPRFNHIRKLTIGTSLADALKQATEFEGDLFRLEMREAHRADLATSHGHSRMGEAWQNSPGKEFIEAIDLSVDELSSEQKSLLTGHLDWLMPQENWSTKGQNEALRSIERSLETVGKLRENLAALPPRPPRRNFQDGAEYPHQLAAQLERALVLMQRDYCHELGRINPAKNQPTIERHRLLSVAVRAYFLWLPDNRAISDLGKSYHPNWRNLANLTVMDDKYTKPFGDFLDCFTENAWGGLEAYKMNPRSPTFQATIKETLRTMGK